MKTRHPTERMRHCLVEYARGATEGDSAPMRRVMHEDAQIFGYLDGELFAGPMKLLYDYVDEHDGAPSIRWQATLVDESNGVGTARVVIEDWHGHNFVDYFTMFEIEGKWKIMNKVFSHE